LAAGWRASTTLPGWPLPRAAARRLAVESDATTLGAHGGAPGSSRWAPAASRLLDAAGDCRIAGGFGFPSGDEASGAWLGMRALAYAQQALDGRAPRDAFAEALLGATGADDRDALVQWSCDANQTIYARLAPIVFAHRDHPHAAALIAQAGEEIGKMIDALDPRHALPVALCGGLADALAPAVPRRHAARLRAPLDDSAHGALRLALKALAAAGAG
jgi:glucosamine kinase